VVAVVGSPQLAEDQVAEAFTKAWMSWRKVRHHPAPRAWVVRTALNTGASWRELRGPFPLPRYGAFSMASR
jgi:DNA-directed RNA polymerase specialized sigma24 family protein